jgi:hypothetical protein
MDNSVEPTDVAAKVAEYIQALSKYKKANKDQKKKMGGTGEQPLSSLLSQQMRYLSLLYRVQKES